MVLRISHLPMQLLLKVGRATMFCSFCDTFAVSNICSSNSVHIFADLFYKKACCKELISLKCFFAATDYPPRANAGSNVIISLPQKSVTLYGNSSTDDKKIVSYEWTQTSDDKLAVDMVVSVYCCFIVFFGGITALQTILALHIATHYCIMQSVCPLSVTVMRPV